MRINIKAFALTCSLFWGLAIFLATWWLILFEGVTKKGAFLGQFYRGYRITPLGSVIGLVWGMVDGLVSGALFAWTYNELTGVFGEREKEIDRHHHRLSPDHLPWLYALVHKMPGIHA